MKRYLLFLCLFISIASFAQVTPSNLNGPKALGMGEIGSTLSGIYACYNNPANAFSGNRFEANLSAVNHYELRELTTFQLAALYKLKRFGNIGAVIGQFGTGVYKDQKFGLLYSLRITKKIRVGAKFDWFHNRVQGYSNIDVITFDLGAVFDVSKKVKLSLHLFNPINQKYTQERALPTVMAIGVKYLVSEMVEVHAEIEKNTYYPFRIKSAILYYPTEQFGVILGMYTDEDAASISGGFQFLFTPKLSFDFGISYNLSLGISSGLGMDYYFRD